MNSRTTILNSILIVGLYIASGYVGRYFAIPPGIVSPLWPPSGVAVAMILLLGLRFVPSIFIGSFIFNLLIAPKFAILAVLTSAIIGFGAMLQAYVTAWLILKSTNTTYPFTNIYIVTLFFSIAFFSCCINSLIGTTTLYQFGLIHLDQFRTTLINWWLGDTVGVIAVTPTILAIVKETTRSSRIRYLELFIISALIFSVTVLNNIYQHPLAVLYVPISILAAIRYDFKISCITSGIIAIIVLLSAVHGLGEFVVADLNQSILFVQGFVSVIFFVTIIIFASKSEIVKANQELHEINVDLENRVAEKTRTVVEKNTELEKAMLELKKTQSQLVQSEKMSSLGILTAGIAHEINNPINFITNSVLPLIQDIHDLTHIIKQYRDLATKEISSDKLKPIKEIEKQIDLEYVLDEIVELTNAIQSGAERTSEIVKNLRTFSRLGESEAKLADLHENINATLGILYNEYKNRITINKHYAELPPIDCYAGKLNQVFMNVILNSIQSILGNGTIDITTEKLENSVRIIITDTGSGMKPEDIPHIFEPFFTTKTVGKGMGLGLSISYKIIVEDHHGSIQYKSELGKGTICIITLPIAN